MRTEQQQLHELYNKHELVRKVYKVSRDPYHIWTMLTQCPCGDWFVYNGTKCMWEPLYGHIAADFINANPEIYPALKAWWPDKPYNPEHQIPWEDIDRFVDDGIKAKQAPKEVK